MARPLCGISACLLGQRVRWDGREKRAPYVEELALALALAPVCPEVELGLGVPREPIRLERDGARVALRAIESRRDLTEAMRSLAERRLAELLARGLAGFVLKARSPSCGPGAVPVWDGEREVARDAGRFAAALIERAPGLPVADEEQLADPAVRAEFVARVRGYRR
jgi:uncharacterized protein YbbK (DUF523 family)